MKGATMKRMIDINLADGVISVVADQLGFRLTRDTTPGADAWTLSAGHGDSLVEYSGTKATVCAFLGGYATMSLKASELLNELDNAGRRMIDAARDKLRAENERLHATLIHAPRGHLQTCRDEMCGGCR